MSASALNGSSCYILQVVGATVAIPRSVDFAQGVAAETQVSVVFAIVWSLDCGFEVNLKYLGAKSGF